MILRVCCDPHKPPLPAKSGCTRWCFVFFLADAGFVVDCMCLCVCQPAVCMPTSIEGLVVCTMLPTRLCTELPTRLEDIAAAVVNWGVATARRLKCPWLAAYTPTRRCQVCWELGCSSPCCYRYWCAVCYLGLPSADTQRLGDKRSGVTPFVQQYGPCVSCESSTCVCCCRGW